ncbi:tRNA pseudouridine synthase B [Helicobacter mustelae 12198]|uniref:tRNA pseudouridine(55) synthase n=2 Tax=Helicobacter mustelae TaxID=217 RepID=D3UI89_HELM1|nr:tRNA pseudouridine synthase B [Helicobacter mustelae 12198]
MSSNQYLSYLKKKYQQKSGGYLGTLDPFAKGLMIVAFGQYTKIFPYLQGSKLYRGVLWLGASSRSLDIENISQIQVLPPFDAMLVREIVESLRGKISYEPPRFSAKRIQGRRAYDLARKNLDFSLPQCEMEIFDSKFLGYEHPFVSFEVRVSKGAYVRSIGELIAQRLGVSGALCMLERREEAGVTLQEDRGEKILNPLDLLQFPLFPYQDKEWKNAIFHGKKLCIKNVNFGIYVANFEDFFSIIEVKKDGEMHYLQNRIYKC